MEKQTPKIANPILMVKNEGRGRLPPDFEREERVKGKVYVEIVLRGMMRGHQEGCRNTGKAGGQDMEGEDL